MLIKLAMQIFLVFIGTLFYLTVVGFNKEQDSLHKRTFNISLSETKNDIVAKKVIADKIYFKNGKLFSDFLFNKFGYKYISYRINKDSIFTDFTETEVRLLEVEAAVTNEKDETIIINFVTSEWDIEGKIKITKHDKLKRHYDFVGREKGGKPKKEKKKKKKILN